MNRTTIKELVANKLDSERNLADEQIRIYGARVSPHQLFLTDERCELYYAKVQAVTKFLSSSVQSANPFNSHGVKEMLLEKFEHKTVKFTSYKEYDREIGFELSGGRLGVGTYSEGVLTQMALYIIHGSNLQDGWNRNSPPIMLDRQGRILDGAQRLMALKMLPDCKFSVIIFDYEHPKDTGYSRHTI